MKVYLRDKVTKQEVCVRAKTFDVVHNMLDYIKCPVALQDYEISGIVVSYITAEAIEEFILVYFDYEIAVDIHERLSHYGVMVLTDMKERVLSDYTEEQLVKYVEEYGRKVKGTVSE